MKKKIPFIILLSSLLGLFFVSPKVANNYNKTNKDNDGIVTRKERVTIYSDSDTSLSIIVIVAVTGITITGGYIYLKKGNKK